VVINGHRGGRKKKKNKEKGKKKKGKKGYARLSQVLAQLSQRHDGR
jgi:hypothetical protein